MKSGILNTYKPVNMTSFSMVAVVRGITREKAGHLGTLDPMAEGVLPVGIGGASRVMDYLDADIKEYRGTARLGLRTDTQDVWGTVIEDSADISVEPDRLRDAAAAMTGVISQIFRRKDRREAPLRIRQGRQDSRDQFKDKTAEGVYREDRHHGTERPRFFFCRKMH